jgi:hypothetical protein
VESKIWKFLHAIEHRAFLLFETRRLKELGLEFPSSFFRDIWKLPTEIEDFIHIKAFLPQCRPRKNLFGRRWGECR